MRKYLHRAPLGRILAIGLLGLAVAACDDADTNTDGDAGVEAQAQAIERGALCDAVKEVINNGRDRCCIQSAAVAEASCGNLDAILDVQATLTGVVTYDAEAAGAWVRDLETAGAGCVPNPAMGRYNFLQGTLQDGDDCTLAGASFIQDLACAPGLACMAVGGTEDEAPALRCAPSLEPIALVDGETCDPEGDANCVSGRCDAISSTCLPRSEAGASCEESADCISGVCTDGSAVEAGDRTACSGDACVCADNVEFFCEPEPEPPANLSQTDPALLCVKARNSTYGGTNGDVVLMWLNSGDDFFSYCIITEKISRSERVCCSPSKTQNLNSWVLEDDLDEDQIGIAFLDKQESDALQIEHFRFYYDDDDGDRHYKTRGTFDDYYSIQSCSDCNIIDGNCDYCTIDGPYTGSRAVDIGMTVDWDDKDVHHANTKPFFYPYFGHGAYCGTSFAETNGVTGCL